VLQRCSHCFCREVCVFVKTSYYRRGRLCVPNRAENPRLLEPALVTGMHQQTLLPTASSAWPSYAVCHVAGSRRPNTSFCMRCVRNVRQALHRAPASHPAGPKLAAALGSPAAARPCRVLVATAARLTAPWRPPARTCGSSAGSWSACSPGSSGTRRPPPRRRSASRRRCTRPCRAPAPAQLRGAKCAGACDATVVCGLHGRPPPIAATSFSSKQAAEWLSCGLADAP
jgi:hypothetical protein